MQEQINEKTVALSIKTAKLTAEVLQKAIRKMLSAKSKAPKIYKGKQTLKHLMKQNTGVSSMEITDANIKAFEPIAKKYGLDYSLTKVKGEEPPRYLVFFKGRDVDVMTEAFKEFAAKQLNKEKKPSIRKALAAFKEKAKQMNQNREKVKNKDRGREL
ncbi:MAG: PcfB family protein [Oscillospiraceae bacterium]|nr:PcfB family protein [Oscillospiraceae bacterium]